MRRPLTDVPFTEVLVRVGFRVVERDWRKGKREYAGRAFAAVYDLGEEMRAAGFVNVYWTLNQCARWLACGYTLRAWRDELRPDQHMRAMHKQRGAMKRR